MNQDALPFNRLNAQLLEECGPQLLTECRFRVILVVSGSPQPGFCQRAWQPPQMDSAGNERCVKVQQFRLWLMRSPTRIPNYNLSPRIENPGFHTFPQDAADAKVVCPMCGQNNSCLGPQGRNPHCKPWLRLTVLRKPQLMWILYHASATSCSADLHATCSSTFRHSHSCHTASAYDILQRGGLCS